MLNDKCLTKVAKQVVAQGNAVVVKAIAEPIYKSQTLDLLPPQSSRYHQFVTRCAPWAVPVGVLTQQ